MTIQNKHTPGPWQLDALDSDGAFEIWSTPLGSHEMETGFVICSRLPIGHRAEASRANARLIAAAPDHHAAAVEIDRLMLVIESAVRTADPKNRRAVMAALVANRAAIDKALGRAG
jgi:hypothetical protein